MTARVLSLASFFSIAAGEYKHFRFDAAARATARNVIWGIGCGILLLALYLLYQRKIPGGVVRAIVQAEAFCAESAKTVQELQLKSPRLCLFAIYHNATLKKLVCRVQPSEEEKDAPVRFYIPEEKRYHAQVRFEGRGASLRGFILTALLTFAFCILLIKMMPLILSMIDNMIG